MTRVVFADGTDVTVTDGEVAGSASEEVLSVARLFDRTQFVPTGYHPRYDLVRAEAISAAVGGVVEFDEQPMDDPPGTVY